MKTALLVIATGSRYREYARRLLLSAEKFFPPHDVFLWSDSDVPLDGITGAVTVMLKHGLGYPNETLYRYGTILGLKYRLLEYAQLFYCDADMEFVATVGDVFSHGITATLHPGYYVQNTRGTPETRPESTAYCPNLKRYFCGGFNGGDARAYITMAEDIHECVHADARRGIMAVWHDESHLNRYLANHHPEKVLSPSYCFPEGAEKVGYCGWTAEQCPPILVALTKQK